MGRLTYVYWWFRNFFGRFSCHPGVQVRYRRTKEYLIVWSENCVFVAQLRDDPDLLKQACRLVTWKQMRPAYLKVVDGAKLSYHFYRVEDQQVRFDMIWENVIENFDVQSFFNGDTADEHIHQIFDAGPENEKVR